MKNLYRLIALVLLIAGTSLCCNAKTAILVAHYGSSDDQTRSRTIDLITADIKAAYPEIEVREAYISPVVRRALSAKGIRTLSPAEALDALHRDGYDTVAVQSSTIIEGAEMAEVRAAAAEKGYLFKNLRLGRPLCYSPDDCLEVVDILCSEAPADSVAIVYAGHGNMLPSTATYCQLDRMIHDRGVRNIHVSTIEGYPTVESTIHELAETPDVKTVVLRPLLLVCGNHTKNDIAGDFATALKDAGYATSVIFEGFAENAAIRRIYLRRLAALLTD